MKRIEIQLDNKIQIVYTCQDEDVQAIADMFKRSVICNEVGDSIKDQCKMDIFTIVNPKPHPAEEPKRKKIKLVPFLNWV